MSLSQISEERRKSLDAKAYWMFCQDPENCTVCNEYTATVKNIIEDNQLLILYPEVPEIPEDGVLTKVAYPYEKEVLDISDQGVYSKIATRKLVTVFEIEDRMLKTDIIDNNRLMCSPACKNKLCRKWWKELYMKSSASFVPSQKAVKKDKEDKANENANANANDSAN